MQLRCVDYKGRRYLSAEDVALFIEEVASSEETDVRRRLQNCADVLLGREGRHNLKDSDSQEDPSEAP